MELLLLTRDRELGLKSYLIGSLNSMYNVTEFSNSHKFYKNKHTESKFLSPTATFSSDPG